MSEILRLAPQDDIFLRGEAFAIPQSFDAKEYIDEHFGVFSSEKHFRVKVHCSKKISPYIQERVWHKSQEVVEHEDGSITLSFETNQLYPVVRWVLGLGKHALVHEPAELIDALKEEIEGAYRNYF